MQGHILGRVKQRRLKKARPVRVGLRRLSGSLRTLPDASSIALRHAPTIHRGATPTALLTTSRETL